MSDLSPTQTSLPKLELLAYAFASIALACLYGAMIQYLDSLPCHEILCNLEWFVAFFAPIAFIWIASPLVNVGLMHWERRRPVAKAPVTRLFFSAIGTAFSLLLIAFFISDFSRRGLDNADLSPQSLIFAVAFCGLSWLNLHCVLRIMRRQYGAAVPA